MIGADKVAASALPGEYPPFHLTATIALMGKDVVYFIAKKPREQ
jgi:hypothetical protein